MVMPQAGAQSPPNFIIIVCDDLGYGDLGCFGNPTIRTPRIDALAAEGQRWTQFYAGASVCTPSRAALLTGREPVRSGMASDRHRVLYPDSAGGLPVTELTVARLLRDAGYATAAIGKWHLGVCAGSRPRDHGFDSYWGIPYSNDMNRRPQPRSQELLQEEERFDAYQVPIWENETVIEQPADHRTLTRRYTERAVAFIRRHTGQVEPSEPTKSIPEPRPYFLYLAHSMPHTPLFRSSAFKGRSDGGIYGDVIEELDDSTGQIIDAVRAGVARQTYVFFTSDNGPWLFMETSGGSPGPLRDGKGTSWEGGFRVPGVFWAWPEALPRGDVHALGSVMDFLPTLCSLARVKLPEDRVLDGFDLTPVLHGNGPPPRHELFYYLEEDIFAIRRENWKIHFKTPAPSVAKAEPHVEDPPLLYDLDVDPGERYPVQVPPKGVIEELTALRDAHRKSIDTVPNQLDRVSAHGRSVAK
jgi:arylsulfatase A-like enzyme